MREKPSERKKSSSFLCAVLSIILITFLFAWGPNINKNNDATEGYMGDYPKKYQALNGLVKFPITLPAHDSATRCEDVISGVMRKLGYKEPLFTSVDLGGRKVKFFSEIPISNAHEASITLDVIGRACDAKIQCKKNDRCEVIPS